MSDARWLALGQQLLRAIFEGLPPCAAWSSAARLPSAQSHAPCSLSQALECPLRRVACQHCDLELAFSRLQEHEDYCGARTERCVRCSRNVMLKDLKEHPKDCGERAEEVRVAQAKPGLNSGAVLHDLQAMRGLLQAGDALPRPGRGLEDGRLYNCLSGDRPPKEPNRRSLTPVLPARNPGEGIGSKSAGCSSRASGVLPPLGS